MLYALTIPFVLISCLFDERMSARYVINSHQKRHARHDGRARLHRAWRSVDRDGRIADIGGTGQTADTVIDATGCAVLPGFVQTHIHLCQTLFRGAADDLALIDWLKKRVWPMEAAHSAESIAASARLGIAELIKGGTTCALTMETVNHTDEVFKVVEETGFRATVGKCMMDKGDEVPAALHEETGSSIDESLALA